jgi:hypothetical protein
MKKIFSTLFVLFAGMTAFAQDATVSVEDVTLEAGGQATFTIDVTNATNYIGAGMYVNLPEGFTFVYDEDEELYALGGDVFAKSHDVADKLQKPNVLKFVITSMKNATFKNDEGSLVEITITVGDNQASGKYEGSLSTIEFSKANKGGLFTMDDVAFNIEVGAADAIEALDAEGAQISEVYSVSGAQQNGLQKGVNIVKYANGEVKKVIVK